jgi:hypothetical protein
MECGKRLFLHRVIVLEKLHILINMNVAFITKVNVITY